MPQHCVNGSGLIKALILVLTQNDESSFSACRRDIEVERHKYLTASLKVYVKPSGYFAWLSLLFPLHQVNTTMPSSVPQVYEPREAVTVAHHNVYWRKEGSCRGYDDKIDLEPGDYVVEIDVDGNNPTVALLTEEGVTTLDDEALGYEDEDGEYTELWRLLVHVSPSRTSFQVRVTSGHVVDSELRIFSV